MDRKKRLMRIVTAGILGVLLAYGCGGGHNDDDWLNTGTGTGTFSATGTNGELLVAKRAGGTTWDYGRAVTTLVNDSFVVVGHFSGSAVFGPGELNETTLVSPGDDEIFVARYNPDGTLRWAKRAGGTRENKAFGVSSLSDGSIVVCGQIQGIATFGAGEANETVLNTFGNQLCPSRFFQIFRLFYRYIQSQGCPFLAIR